MKETRNCNLDVRSIPESRSVEGYALIFNSESRDLGGFIEIIDPSSLNGVIEKSDVCCWLDHNEDRGILARSKFGAGSLELIVDEKGLKYRFDAPNTALGDELLEGLKRGDITASSFAFSTEKDEWEKRSDNMYIRKITKLKEIFDVSPVYKPAYESTSVEMAKRSLDHIKMKENDELANYFKNLKEGII